MRFIKISNSPDIFPLTKVFSPRREKVKTAGLNGSLMFDEKWFHSSGLKVVG